MPFFEYQNRKLFYERTGSGNTALLMIHGLLGNHKTWKYQVEYFKEKYNLILIDCFGHGQSDKDLTPLEWPRLTAETCVALMNFIDRPYFAVGHSFASNILPEIIKLEVTGTNFQGAVFVDSTYQGFDEVIESRAKFGERMLKLTDEALPKEAELWFTRLIGDKIGPDDKEELIMESFRGCDFHWIFESVKACREYCKKYPPEKTPKWENQRIYIIEAGKTLGQDFRKSWTNHFKDARYYLFENEHHFFYISQHESFNRLLERFFEEKD